MSVDVLCLNATPSPEVHFKAIGMDALSGLPAPFEEENDDEDIEVDDGKELLSEKRLETALNLEELGKSLGSKKKTVVDKKKKASVKPKAVKGKKPLKKTPNSVNDEAVSKNDDFLLADAILDSVDNEHVIAKPEIDQLASEAMIIQEEDEEQGGFEFDLNINEIINRTKYQDPYTKACKTLGVAPVSYIISHIDSTELILKHHGLGARGAQALSQILELNTTLVKLDLSNNAIEFGGMHLCQALAHNTSVTHLDISDNNLGKSGTEIAKLLINNHTLKTLIAKGNKFGDKEATAIAEGLKHNAVLTILDLSHNQIGDIGGIAIGNSLAVNSGLWEIDIGWNHIRIRGANALFNGAKDNTAISDLNFQHNGIGDNGAGIVLYLQKNSSINRLNLAHCRIDDAAMAQVLKGLEVNKSLIELDVSGNDLGTSVVLNLLKLIPQTRIMQLGLKNLRLSTEVLGKIHELLKDKPDLKIIA